MASLGTHANAAAATGARYGGIDLARLVLALCVVLAHCATFQAVGDWAHFFFNNGLARIIVPFFLLTTGYFFERQMQAGLAPWLWRVGRIYLAWTLIYLPFLLFYQAVTPYRIALTLFFGFFHLWYLPALLGGMALLYVMRNLRDGVLFWSAFALFLVGSALQYAENLWLDLNAFDSPYDLLVVTRNFLFYGFPYLALGLLIRRREPIVGQPALVRLAALAAGFLFLGAECLLEFRLFDPNGFFDLTVSAFVLTPVLFIAVRDLPLVLPGFDPRKLSMVVYLSHPLYLLPLRELTGAGPLALTVMTLAVTLLLAPAWLWMARRLPILP